MKTAFLITIDVETKSHGDPRQDIFGFVPGHEQSYGIELMMDMLERHRMRGTFFLNAYEVAKHGEEFVARAARMIQSRGHDLELHTHPLPMYRYYGMSKAPLEQQVAILERGISLIEGWTGRKVRAHRAGAFAANADTLRAVEAVGLSADCSLSPGSRVPAPLISELGPSNLARHVDGVWEIPVTYYDQVRVGPWRSNRILDIEASSLPEIKRVTRWAIRHHLPTVCLLMHSFSFCRHGRPDYRAIKRFSALLAWLGEQEDIDIATVEQACGKLDATAAPRPEPGVPCTGIVLTWGRALASWNDGWKNLLVSVSSIVWLAMLVLALCILGMHLRRHSLPRHTPSDVTRPSRANRSVLK